MLQSPETLKESECVWESKQLSVDCLAVFIKHMKVVGNSLRTSEKLWWNNQIISTCYTKVYLCKITMNGKLIRAGLSQCEKH